MEHPKECQLPDVEIAKATGRGCLGLFDPEPTSAVLISLH